MIKSFLATKGSFFYGNLKVGRYVSPSGEEYEGEWKDKKQNGKGKKKWPNGQKYEGEYWGGAKLEGV